tara:strand:+ start:4057 stop:4929 length:873 start_codon:yes stop_codon:yes gene_type:complete
MKKINFEDIQEYSDLPEKILNSSNEHIKYKTEQEVLREFNTEKWSLILNDIASDKNINLHEIDQKMEAFDVMSPFFYKGDFYLASGKEVFNMHLEIFDKVISKYINEHTALVELGAGYGSKILNLSNKKKFHNVQLFAAEFTENGCNAIKQLSARMNKEVQVGYCDLKKHIIKEISIPKNSVIYTSYALHYVQKLSDSFIDFILSFEPKIVINFEPCFEAHDDYSYGKLCKRYIELNDYNIDMITVLNNASKKGLIDMKVEKNVIGGNPFLPISIIEWNSTKKTREKIEK